MGLDRPIDITAEQREILPALLERHLPGVMARVYGSRLNGAQPPRQGPRHLLHRAPGQLFGGA